MHKIDPKVTLTAHNITGDGSIQEVRSRATKVTTDGYISVILVTHSQLKTFHVLYFFQNRFFQKVQARQS